MHRVDESRIVAVGFSYGGWTALSMGGATGNLAGYAAYCDEWGSGRSFSDSDTASAAQRSD